MKRVLTLLLVLALVFSLWHVPKANKSQKVVKLQK